MEVQDARNYEEQEDDAPPPSVPTNKLMRGALAYAQLGWPVFPLEPRGKRPITPDGFKSATTDYEKIQGWWISNPNANIGGVAGPHWDVLDVDPPHGEVSLEVLEKEFGALPGNMMQQTTGRGRQIFFEPGSLPTSAGVLGPGLDTRGESKGYVVLPPSIHPNKKIYTWVENGPFGDSVLVAPDERWKKLFADTFADRSSQRVDLRAENVEQVVIKSGRRNDFLMRRAGILRRSLGVTGEVLEDHLRLENRRLCDPPLKDHEIKQIVASASRYVDPKVDGGKDAPDSGDRNTWVEQREKVGDVTWCWPGWIPNAQLTLIAGEPSIGKSALAINIAGALASGGFWPDGQEVSHKGIVVWCESEGSHAENFKRAAEFGFDLKNFVSPLPPDKEFDDFRIDDAAHLDMLRYTVETFKPSLIVLDALGAAHRQKESDAAIHGVLADLRAVCQVYQIPGLVLHHLRKAPPGGRDEIALDDIRGSGAIAAVCRSVIALDIPDRDQPDNRRITQVKSNFGAKSAALGFVWRRDEGTDESVLVFGAAPRATNTKTKRDKASNALIDYLGDGLDHNSVKVQADLREAGFSTSTIRRAASDLEVQRVIEQEAKWDKTTSTKYNVYRLIREDRSDAYYR